ncbi:unnamed protein product [Prunus brigantina]
MVGSKRTRRKTAAMAQSVMAQSHSTHDPAIDMVAPPPLTVVLPTELAAETTAPAAAAEHGGTSHPGGLTTAADFGPILEQLQAFPPLPSRSTHAPAYTSNETLAHMQLGSTHFSHPDPRSQVDLNLRVDQLTQRMDDQNNLMRQLLNQINLAQNLGLGQQGEERRMDEHADTCRHVSSICKPHTKQTNHQRDRPSICAEDVEKLVNNRLRDLKIGGNFEDALRMEVDRANSSPFTAEIEQVAPPKRFSTPSFTCFKGDSDPESHLKHFKSLMILQKTEDALMCKVFAMTLRGAAQDWFHTLPSKSISSFKELAYVLAKEYISYRTIKKNPDHLFNMHKKSDESLRDYIKRFKAERANIVGCDDQIASSAFKRGLPTECELYRELTISPCRTLVEVFATAERYALWDDDRIAAKKADQAAKQASQENGKRISQPQEGAPAAESYTKFTIPIHQILAQVKDMPWLKKPSPLKGNPTKKDTSKYCTFHEGHGHYTNNCFAWKRHLEDLVKDGHCTEFIARGAIQQIKDCDAANDEPPRKKSYGSTRS